MSRIRVESFGLSCNDEAFIVSGRGRRHGRGFIWHWPRLDSVVVKLSCFGIEVPYLRNAIIAKKCTYFLLAFNMLGTWFTRSHLQGG